MTVIPGVASPRAPVCEEIAGHGTCEVYVTDGTWRRWLGTGAEPEQNTDNNAMQSVITQDQMPPKFRKPIRNYVDYTPEKYR